MSATNHWTTLRAIEPNLSPRDLCLSVDNVAPGKSTKQLLTDLGEWLWRSESSMTVGGWKSWLRPFAHEKPNNVLAYDDNVALRG
jgi:hypothetical protein